MDSVFAVPLLILGYCLQTKGLQITIWQVDDNFQNKVPNASVIEKSFAHSRIACVSMCAENDNAAVPGVFYNNDVKQCLCSLTLQRPISSLSNSQGFVYYVQQSCEIDGYTELQAGFCVKPYDTAYPYTDCENYCSFEGGRLVKVDSMAKYNVLKNHLIAVTVKSSMVYYIDGTKVGGAWKFSDNNTIPSNVMVWAPSEPNNDDCLSLYTSQFQHGDTTCSGYVNGYNFGFICERVI